MASSAHNTRPERKSCLLTRHPLWSKLLLRQWKSCLRADQKCALAHEESSKQPPCDGWQPGNTPCAKAHIPLGLAPWSQRLMGMSWRAQAINLLQLLHEPNRNITEVAGTAPEGKASHNVPGAAWDGDKAPKHPFSSSALALGVINPPSTPGPACALPYASAAWSQLHQVPAPASALGPLLGTAQADKWSKHTRYYQQAESQPSAPKGT